VKPKSLIEIRQQLGGKFAHPRRNSRHTTERTC
jgi:hypothetical protein